MNNTFRRNTGGARRGRGRGLSLFAVAAICLACAAPAGAANYGFANFAAIVAANGVTTRGSGVHASSNSGPGRYIVEFTRPVSTCAYVASPRGVAGGQVSAMRVAGRPNKIAVRTFNKSGVAANISFVVLVSCPTFSGPIGQPRS